MRAAAVRLEALADEMDSKDGAEDDAEDHPDLRPRGLAMVGGIRR